LHRPRNAWHQQGYKQAMNAPLSFSPIAKTTSADETEHLFQQQVIASRILSVKKGDDFSVEMNGVLIGRSALTHLRHLSDYDVDHGSVDSNGKVIFAFGYGSLLTSSFNGETVALNRSAIVINNPIDLEQTRTAQSCEVIIKSPVQDLKERLQIILDRSISRELVFEPSVSMDKGVGAHARSTLFYILNSLDSDPTLLDNPLLVANFEELIFGILLALPNSYSAELLAPGDKSTAPAIVCRAEEFMEANAASPIAIADVLSHTACSRKALFTSFRKFRNYTPLNFLADARLRLAHQRLCDASNSESVTSIAYNSGFSHMGRFSEIYHKRYGVKPSETLRRAAL
jgi:AraC-like DNA-binding protein